MTAAADASTYRRDFPLADTASRHDKLPDWRNDVFVGVAPYRRRFKNLAAQADTLRPLWRDLRDYMAPQCGRWLDGTLGTGVWQPEKTFTPYDSSKIINGELQHIINTCVSGLKYSFTSAQKPWFLFSTLDKELAYNNVVRSWLDATRDTERDVLAGSNFYDAMNRIYYETCTFGPGVGIIDPDPVRKINVVPLTIGEYVLAEDHTSRIDTCYTRMEMTAEQLRQKFGDDNDGYSQEVKDALKDPDRMDERFGVIRAMQPIGAFGRPPFRVQADWKFESVYFLESSDDRGERAGAEKNVLRWEWHRTMPFVAVRWAQTSKHPYGVSPGMECLPDQIMLQGMESDYADAVEFEMKPPLVADAETAKDIKRHGRLTPGSVLVANGTGQNQGARPAYQVHPNYAEYRMHREVILDRIRKAFHYHRWVAMEQNERQMTATEVDARINEKLAQLAPIVESHHSELFNPALERIYFICLHDLGLILPPPPIMSGREFRIEYEGDYSKSIKQIEISRTKQFTFEIIQTAGSLAQISPQDAQAVIRNVDFAAGVRFIGRQYDIDPDIIRDESEVDRIAQAEAAQAKAMQERQDMAGMVDAAQKLGNTPYGQGNALDAIMPAGAEGGGNAPI